MITDSDWISYVAKCHDVYCDLTEVSSTWGTYFGQRKDSITSIGDVSDFLGSSRLEASGTAGSSFDISFRWSGEPIRSYLEALLSVPIDDELVPNLPVDICLFGKHYNTAFVWNYLAIAEIDRYIRSVHALKTDSFFELGGGFGCMASILIRKYRPSYYFYCDLKENLRNAIAYFRHSLQSGCSIHLIACEADIPASIPGITRICLIAPEFITGLSESLSIDIAINSDSLGEMKRKTAEDYIQIISDLMSDSAVFFSFNGHRRGNLVQEGFNRVADYYPNHFLNISQIGPKPYLSSALEDYGHIAICKKHVENSNADDFLRDRWLNVLTDIYALGFSKEVSYLTDLFNDNNLGRIPLSTLEDLEYVLEHGEIRRDVHDLDPRLEHLILYTTQVQLLCTRPNKKMAHEALSRLETTVPHLQSDVPKFIFLLLAFIYKFKVTLSIQMTPLLTFCLRELEIAKSGMLLSRKLYKELRLSQLRKKFFPRRKYHPSLVALIHGKVSGSLVMRLISR